MKSLAGLMAVLVLMAGLTAGGQQGSQDKKASDSRGKVVVGAAIQGNKSTFMQFVVAGMYQYQEQHPQQVELRVVYADDQADKQITQVESFAAAGVQAIVLNPVSVVASSPAVDVAVEAKIPILTVNTKVENQQKAAAYIGSNDEQAGELQMERLLTRINGKGNIAIIQAVIGHSAQIGRDRGFDRVLARYPQAKLVYRQPADWSTDKAKRLVENWLQREISIDAVATHVDMMAHGAVYAFEERGIVIPPVGGMDSLDAALDMIATGKMDNTIWQDGIGQGYHSVRLAVDAAQGKAVADYDIPFELVTKDNLDLYRKKVSERNLLAKKYF